MPSVELRVELEPGDGTTSVSHQRVAWELAQDLSERPRVSRVTITERPHTAYQDGEVSR